MISVRLLACLIAMLLSACDREAGGSASGDASVPGHPGPDGGAVDASSPPDASTPPTSWTKQFGDSESQEANAVAVDSDGHIILVGSYQGAIDLGGGTLPWSNYMYNAYVSKLAADGSHIWSHQIGGFNYDDGAAVAVDGRGDVFAAGYVHGVADFGAGADPLEGSDSHDAFVVKLSHADGSLIWAKRFGNPNGADSARALAVDRNGDVFVGGQLAAPTEIGGTPIAAGTLFVAKLAGNDGTTIWAKGFGQTGNDFLGGVAVDGGGNLVVTGSFRETLALGGEPLVSAGVDDIFVAKLAGTNGAHLWSKRLGGSAFDAGYAVAVHETGAIAIVGSVTGTVDFGDGPTPGTGLWDTFTAVLEPDGAIRWIRRAGSPRADEGLAVTFDTAGDVLWGGSFSETVDFGGASLTSAGEWDGFILRNSATDGTVLSARRYGGLRNDEVLGLTISPSGKLVVTGRFLDVIDLGTGSMTSAGNFDAFLAALDW